MDKVGLSSVRKWGHKDFNRLYTWILNIFCQNVNGIYSRLFGNIPNSHSNHFVTLKWMIFNQSSPNFVRGVSSNIMIFYSSRRQNIHTYNTAILDLDILTISRW